MNVQQVYSKDCYFWHPKTKRAYDNPLWASVSQIDGRSKISIPATSRAVQRTNGYAAYLKYPFYFQPTIFGLTPPPLSQVTRLSQTYPDEDGVISDRTAVIYRASDLDIVSDGNPSTPPVLSVGDYLLVEDSFNTTPTETQLVTEDPIDSVDDKPYVGVFGQSASGIVNEDTQNLWLIGGNFDLASAVGFLPKPGIDTVVFTKNPDNSLDIVSTNRELGGRLFPVCCVLESDNFIDELFYVGGLTDWLTGTTDARIFSITGDTYVTTACPEVMVQSAAISCEDSHVILVTGGMNDDFTDSKDSVCWFNPYDESWPTAFSTLLTARRQHQMIKVVTSDGDNHILVVGGKSGIISDIGQTGPDVSPIGFPISKCEILNVQVSWDGELPTVHGEISTIPFAPTGSMSDARYAFGMTKLPDGRVLVCGGIGYNLGYPIPDNTVAEHNYELNSCEIYDPKTGFWSPINRTNDPHSYCVCAYVPTTNKVYVYGGYTSTAIEYLDLDTMLWHKSVYNMPAPVVLGTPVVMANGFLGLIGGGSYDPETNILTPSSFEWEPPS
jgi:hypothetical protein